MKSLLRLIKNTQFAIDRKWGLSQLELILFNTKHGSDFFTEQKEKSKAIDYFTGNKFVGKDSDINQAGTIAVMSISGVMTSEDGWCNVGMSTYDGLLRELYSNSDVAGIILKMDSGGGYVDAGSILHNAISDKNKPIVVLTNFLASAAVMGTLAADEIIAQTSMSEIGSIGVYTSLSKEGLEYYKKNIIDIYSKKSPDKNKDIRDAIEGNFETLTESVTETDIKFMELVKKYRPVSDESTLAGGMFQANDAKKRGLVDSVGSLNYALKRINSLIKN